MRKLDSPDHREPAEQLLRELHNQSILPFDEARALAPALYCDDAIHALELERIFAREWCCVGRAGDFATPGRYLATDIAGEPVLVVGGADGTIRAFSNICRHRGARLLEGTGEARRIVCPYHAWTYDLEGRLKTFTFMRDGFSPDGVCLPEFRTEAWNGWVYVNLDPEAEPLAPRLEPLGRILANYQLASYEPLFRVEEVWPTNWKILIENFTEPYHFFIAHKDTVEPALPTRMTRHEDDGGDGFTLFRQFRAPGVSYEYASDMVVLNDLLSEEERSMYPIINTFPAHVYSVSPERLFWMSLQPLGTDQVRVLWGVDVYPGSIPGGKAGEERVAELRAAFEKINGEDKGIVESIRRNAGSRHAAAGPLSPKERCLWHFQRYLARMLRDPAS